MAVKAEHDGAAAHEANGDVGNSTDSQLTDRKTLGAHRRSISLDLHFKPGFKNPDFYDPRPLTGLPSFSDINASPTVLGGGGAFYFLSGRSPSGRKRPRVLPGRRVQSLYDPVSKSWRGYHSRDPSFSSTLDSPVSPLKSDRDNLKQSPTRNLSASWQRSSPEATGVPSTRGSDDMAAGFQRVASDTRRLSSSPFIRSENRPPMSNVLCRNGPQCRKVQEGPAFPTMSQDSACLQFVGTCNFNHDFSSVPANGLGVSVSPSQSE